MEWLLLYPLVGLAVFPWLYHYEVKYSSMEREDWILILLPLLAIWPYLVVVVPWSWPQGKREMLERKQEEEEAEREFQELEQRVRQEARARVKQDFADFDKELGIEPAWKKAHPGAAMEWENIYEDWVRRRGLPSYSKGGRV